MKEPDEGSDRVWMASNPCPECDIESGPENDDDDFHGCDDCNDLDDADAGDAAADAGGDAADATEVIADIGEAALDLLAAILAENDQLVDGKRVLRRLRSFAKRLNDNPSVKELLAARREAVRGK